MVDFSLLLICLHPSGRNLRIQIRNKPALRASKGFSQGATQADTPGKPKSACLAYPPKRMRPMSRQELWGRDSCSRQRLSKMRTLCTSYLKVCRMDQEDPHTVADGSLGACAQHHLSSRQAIPGSSRPSRNSREAPPPVEMWVILSAKPSCSQAAALSPPPTMVTASESARA